MITQYIETNGITLHCKIEGTGKTILLLHGFPEFWYSWHKIIPLLSNKFKIVAPDMRGYNLSTKPPKVIDYTPEKLVEDIAGLINSLGNEKVILVGHDWGGAIAWLTASKYPNLIEKLIILNAPHPVDFKKQLLSGNWQQIKKSWYMLLFQLPWLPEKKLSKNLSNTFNKIFKGWVYNKNSFSNQDIENYIDIYKQPNAFKFPINYYRAALLYGNDNKKNRHTISIPTLLLWAQNDKALGKELTYNIPQYCTNYLSIKYHDNCSHWIQHEQPEWVAQQIVAFV